MLYTQSGLYTPVREERQTETDRQRWRQRGRDRERQIETETGRERKTCFSRKPSTGI